MTKEVEALQNNVNDQIAKNRVNLDIAEGLVQVLKHIPAYKAITTDPRGYFKLFYVLGECDGNLLVLKDQMPKVSEIVEDEEWNCETYGIIVCLYERFIEITKEMKAIPGFMQLFPNKF